MSSRVAMCRLDLPRDSGNNGGDREKVQQGNGRESSSSGQCKPSIVRSQGKPSEKNGKAKSRAEKNVSKEKLKCYFCDSPHLIRGCPEKRLLTTIMRIMGEGEVAGIGAGTSVKVAKSIKRLGPIEGINAAKQGTRHGATTSFQVVNPRLRRDETTGMKAVKHKKGPESIARDKAVKPRVKIEQVRSQYARMEAWSKLRSLRHKGTLKEYVSRFRRLMLKVPSLTEEYGFFTFMFGLKPWTKNVLERREVKELSKALTTAESSKEFGVKKNKTSKAKPKAKGSGNKFHDDGKSKDKECCSSSGGESPLNDEPDGGSGEDVCNLYTSSSVKDTKLRVMDVPKIELSREKDEPRIEEALRVGSFISTKASRSQVQDELSLSKEFVGHALLNRQALGVIRLTLSCNVAFNIVKDKTTTGLMAALSSMYEKSSALNKVHLMRRLFNLRMAEGESVAQHLNELNTITNQLSFVEIEFDDEVRALILLSSLPDGCNATVISVSSSSKNSKLKFDDVRDLASFHSTPCQEIMENYVSGDFGKVHLADDETLKIVGKGDIRLKLPNQTTWKLTGVRHILGLKRNLISVGQLDGEGYSTTFSGYADGKSNLWNQRLGHMSEKGMKTLLSKRKLSNLKTVDVGLCEDCIFGKQKKVDFEKIGKTPKAEKLELVYTDVWGPSPVTSLAGSLYYVTFIDDSTRKNGVAESMNRNLNERARRMKIHVGLPKFLWAEAINTAAYMINHGPSVPLDGGIPEEVWSKKEINLSHLRVFGCISYVHIDSAERSKLDAKSKKCVFVGYGGDEFGYRFWDYENRKIIKSIDVIFNENVMYKDRSTIESSSSNTEDETKEFAKFEEISGNDVHISPEAFQEEPGTPEVRRSSRIPKPTHRYSPSLHYLLLTDNGEPQCYDEAICQADHYCYIKKFDINFIILLLYVDDMLVEGSKMQEIINLKQKLSKQFAMKDLGAAKQILGMKIKRDTKSRTLILSQAEYINKVLSMFNMQYAKPVSYASAIESLMYAMVCTRPDNAHAVGVVSMYMNNPGRGTILTGYVDVDLAGNVDIKALQGMFILYERFGEETDNLWKRIISAKYNYALDSIVPKVRNISKYSWVWRKIVIPLVSHEDNLSTDFKCIMGNGVKIDFWNDHWTEKFSLKTSFPRIFSLANKKFGMIVEFGIWESGVWVWRIELRRNLFVWENSLWSSFLMVLNKVVSSVPALDRLAWGRSSDGRYSPKSFCLKVVATGKVKDPI
ncbi:hypothetical protein F3Y22_tig00116959pilonHSYRG00039 [Hibiscus syriacus]|uniref:Reverse transcriptase Ty1/copia-type domain-containing protein n=1 Tax=Hibiscus syriacus TaxID=106335 RepID=A0A6A2WX15_HIBSY|nr:hypothetical protein F3Y22_tig00116959pilonHSYRG00039 [Hibiscus syriacus]